MSACGLSCSLAFRGSLLIYVVIPILIRLMGMADPEILTIVCRLLAAAFILDCTLYQIMKKRRGTE